MASFKWVNTTLGNITRARSPGLIASSAPTMPAAISKLAWRYNRRYQLEP